jgi:hypothetical protein
LKRFGDLDESNLTKLFEQLKDSGLLEDQTILNQLKGIKDRGSRIDFKQAKGMIEQIQMKEGWERIKQQRPKLANQVADLQKAIEQTNSAASRSTPKAPPEFVPSPPAQGNVPTGRLQKLLEQLKGVRGMGDVFRHSPAVKKLVKSMTIRALENQTGNHQLDLGKLTGGFERAGDFFGRSLDVFRGSLSGVRGLPVPSLPSPPQLPVGDLASNLPSFGGSGSGGGFGFGVPLVWGAVIVMGALILWQLRKRLGGGLGESGAGKAWRLGSWPVHPGRVATRAELIQAFEYLSLLLLGMAARTWNHLDIALALGAQATGGSREKERAASRLATLYEEARYTPGDGPLAGADLAEARRNLCYLAGVAAA